MLFLLLTLSVWSSNNEYLEKSYNLQVLTFTYHLVKTLLYQGASTVVDECSLSVVSLTGRKFFQKIYLCCDTCSEIHYLAAT